MARSLTGTYQSTFTVTTSTGPCSLPLPPGSRGTAPLGVTQPAPASIALGLSSLSPFVTDPILALNGTQVSYNGPVRLKVTGLPSIVVTNGTITGSVDGKNLNLAFQLRSLICTVAGTIVGSKH